MRAVKVDIYPTITLRVAISSYMASLLENEYRLSSLGRLKSYDSSKKSSPDN